MQKKIFSAMERVEKIRVPLLYPLMLGKDPPAGRKVEVIVLYQLLVVHRLYAVDIPLCYVTRPTSPGPRGRSRFR